MNTRFLETFVTVANLGSFRAAAEQLNVSQATVSSRISSLETDLQVDLFDREFHATRITVAGAMILETAQEMLATERNLRATLSDAPWLPLAEEGRITFLDSWPQFCSQDTCSAVQAGQGQYFDNNHLTNSAAIRIRAVFRPVFQALTRKVSMQGASDR